MGVEFLGELAMLVGIFFVAGVEEDDGNLGFFDAGNNITPEVQINIAVVGVDDDFLRQSFQVSIDRPGMVTLDLLVIVAIVSDFLREVAGLAQ